MTELSTVIQIHGRDSLLWSVLRFEPPAGHTILIARRRHPADGGTLILDELTRLVGDVIVCRVPWPAFLADLGTVAHSIRSWYAMHPTAGTQAARELGMTMDQLTQLGIGVL